MTFMVPMNKGGMSEFLGEEIKEPRKVNLEIGTSKDLTIVGDSDNAPKNVGKACSG